MIVKELIERLQKYNPNDLVVLSQDEEGNGFYTLYKVWEGIYDADNGEVKLRKLTPELIKAGYTEEDVGEGINCITLQ